MATGYARPISRLVVLRSNVNMETGSRKQKFSGNRIRSNLFTPSYSQAVKLSVRVHEQ